MHQSALAVAVFVIHCEVIPPRVAQHMQTVECVVVLLDVCIPPLFHHGIIHAHSVGKVADNLGSVHKSFLPYERSSGQAGKVGR